MRTTIRLGDSLFKEVRRLAVESHRTLTAVIEDALKEVVARSRQLPRRSKLVLPAFKGRGLQPGVDLDNTASLLDLMDSK